MQTLVSFYRDQNCQLSMIFQWEKQQKPDWLVLLCLHLGLIYLIPEMCFKYPSKTDYETHIM